MSTLTEKIKNAPVPLELMEIYWLYTLGKIIKVCAGRKK